MTKQTEALKLALEALEADELDMVDDGSGNMVFRKEQAITAIKKALAQPEQEPNCYGYAARLATSIWKQHYQKTAPEWEVFNDLIGVLTQIDNMAAGLISPPLTVQPEQEPVAWEQFYPDIGKPQLEQKPAAIYRAGQAKGEGFHVEFLKEMGDDEVLLYTTPPKRPWVGLTDEEAQQAFKRHNCDISKDLAGILARAIEAKLKEKNT